MVTTAAGTRLSESTERMERLTESVNSAKNNTFFYKRLFRKHLKEDATQHSILEKFFLLPFTSKEDIVRNYPDGFLGVQMAKVALYSESTGTSGNTLGSTKSASFYTDLDLENDSARRFSPELKVSSDDVIVNALPFALTSSGAGFFMAARKAGAMIVNLDSGSLLSSPTKHIEITSSLKATILICSLPFLYSTLVKMDGDDIRERFNSLRAIQLCGLPTLEQGRKKISEIFGVPVFNTYGLSEFGATTFTCGSGHMHVHEDDFLIEIIDPRTGNSVDNDVGGEIVITTLNREGSPKIRYRTADFGIISYGDCECGRRGPKLQVKGRLRDAAQFGERFRLPIDFEEVIYSFPQTTGLYRLIYSQAPLSEESPEDDTRNTVIAVKIVVDVEEPAENLKVAIEKALFNAFGSSITVELTKAGGATTELVAQQMYSNVRTIKSANFDDQRPAEWLVTY